MNPITNAKNLNKLNDRELALGIAGDSGRSWHQKYAQSAWIFIGGLAFDLTEGDIIAVFSQYGEIVNINYVRDKISGKPKGFCFVCYEDQRSTVLAVDNLNGIKLVGRIIRVDHVENYRMPDEKEGEDDIIKRLHEEGCAPKPVTVGGPATGSGHSSRTSPPPTHHLRTKGESSKKKNKLKKEKKDKKKSRQRSASSENSDDRSRTKPGHSETWIPPGKDSPHPDRTEGRIPSVNLAPIKTESGSGGRFAQPVDSANLTAEERAYLKRLERERKDAAAANIQKTMAASERSDEVKEEKPKTVKRSFGSKSGALKFSFKKSAPSAVGNDGGQKQGPKRQKLDAFVPHRHAT